MAGWYRSIALSNHPLARWARAARHSAASFHVPAPRLIVRPIVSLIIAARAIYWFMKRSFLCEPFFKAYCTRYGKNLRVGVYFHYVYGRGRIIIGDNVTIDGKCTFNFAVRFSDQPTLIVGDQTGIGHNCSFSVAKTIKIGCHCRIASDVWMFDSPGHPAEAVSRKAGLPPDDADVRPVEIGDNVWIGRRSIVFPGVTIGEGSIVSAGSIVLQNVPPYAIVAGNPARKIGVVPVSAARVFKDPEMLETAAPRNGLATVARADEPSPLSGG